MTAAQGMRPGESIVVAGGWVSFGLGLLLRAELVQSVSVEPASDVNRPAHQQPGMVVDPEDTVVWCQVEVKYAPRSAPYVVFVGTENACRCKAAKLARELRGTGL